MLGITIVFPLIAIILAIKRRGRFYKVSLLLSLLSIIIAGYFFYESDVCTAYFCGLGYAVRGVLCGTITAVIAIILALIKPKTKIPFRNPKKNN